MLKIICVGMIACAATPVLASPERGEALRASSNILDRLYPEIALDGASWRGLLPVILLDTDKLAEQPAAIDQRSESGQPQRR